MYGEEVASWCAPSPPAEREHSSTCSTGAQPARCASRSRRRLGIALAFVLYVVRPDPGRVVAALGQVYTAVRRKYYIDEFVDATVIRLNWA
jgi:hypothetical protein